jgi:phosphoenolpyruvate carboxylase
MSQNLNPGDGNSAPSFSVSPQEYAALQQRARELEQYQQESQQFLERLSPIAPHVKRLLEDEEARQVYDDSLNAYDTVRKRQQPQLSREWDPEINPYLKKLDNIAETVSKFSERAEAYERQEKEQANQRLLQENAKYAEDLVKQYPVLAENGYSGIEAIAMRSMQRGISFTEAAAQLEPLYKTPNRQAVDAPTLRSGAGLQGVPGPSHKTVNMKDRFLEIMDGANR